MKKFILRNSLVMDIAWFGADGRELPEEATAPAISGRSLRLLRESREGE